MNPGFQKKVKFRYNVQLIEIFFHKIQIFLVNDVMISKMKIKNEYNESEHRNCDVIRGLFLPKSHVFKFLEIQVYC